MKQSSSVRRLETEQSNNGDFKITVLSPSDNLEGSESYKNYEKRLVAALRHELVLNIALTGIYGSGKSSILNTFKKNHEITDEWSFLEVSLSTFKIEKTNKTIDTEEDEDSKNSSMYFDEEIRSLTPDKIQLIERSILQQFFYAVPQSDIPLSRFKRITENSKENYREMFGVIILGFWSYLYAFELLNIITEQVEFAAWYTYFNFIILILCSLFLIHKIFSYGFGLKEIKFNLHNAEFNIKNEEDKSILNDHLDEILYFFETTGKNVVVIEDLDRFNDTEIFIRLRELNSIINKSCPHRVIFIYAIRDDIFEDSERSKFFDYIIPVIPIVNPTTAYDIIKKEYNNVASSLDNKFLRKTGLFFNDMRLLKNVLNEYQSYLDQLNVLNINKNKLFAMVVYKNYYPKQFSKLNKNDGEIYDIFNIEKQRLVERLIVEKKQEIDSIQTREGLVSKERLKSISELNSIYAHKILEELESMRWTRSNYQLSIIVKVGENTYNIKEIASTGFLKDLHKNQNFNLIVTSTDFNKNLKFGEIEKTVDSERSYISRFEDISAKENGELENLLNEKSDLKSEIQNIRRKKLKDLLREAAINIDKPLLRYFIVNGFIDETYQSYISHFFEESITLNDKNYTILVSSFDNPEFDLKLVECGELIENYLNIEELSTHSALNFSMLDHLLVSRKHKNYLNSYLKVICDGSSLSIEFIKLYFKRNKNLEFLIPKIVDVRESIVDDIDISNDTDESRSNLKTIISHLPVDKYENLYYLTKEIEHELNSLDDYVGFILDCFDNIVDRFKDFTYAVNPNLEYTNFSIDQVNELNWLGENGYLVINKHMIEQILMNNLGLSVVADLDTKPLSTMANSGIDYLTQNLWSENLSEYIRVILLDADENTLYFEDEDIYIKALNGLDSRNLITERFIDINSTKIKDISAVKNYQIQQYLIGSLKVQYSWSNVFKYFSESYEDQDDQGAYREIDGSLVKFLENGQSYLQTINCTESDILDIEDWEDTKAEFDKNLFLCSELSDEAYKKLIDITDNNWDNSNLEDISQEKVQTLISLGKLSLTSENWEQVKEHASKEVVLAFLVKYHYRLIHDLDTIELRPEDIEELFCSNEVSNAHKKVLAESKAINLIESNETVRKKIIEIYENERMSLPVYEQLLKHANFKELRELLLRQIKYLDKYEILKVLELLDVPYQKLAKGEDVEFNNSEENRTLLKALHNAQIVVKIPKAKRPKGNLKGQKVLTTRLQLHVLGN